MCIMMNLRGKKQRKIFGIVTAVVAVLLVVAMILPMIFGM